MLVCRRVKDHLGTVFLKGRIHGCAVFDIADKGYYLQAAKFQAQILVGFINTVLPMPQQNQPPRLKPGRLAAELRTDGAARSRYQDRFAGKVSGDGIQVHLHRFAPEDILNPDLADLAD